MREFRMNLKESLKVMKLSEECKAVLKEWHAKERDGRTADTIKAILLFSEGWTIEKISEVLLEPPEIIFKYLEYLSKKFDQAKFLQEKGISENDMKDLILTLSSLDRDLRKRKNSPTKSEKVIMSNGDIHWGPKWVHPSTLLLNEN
jgi:hypothetical protein